MEDRDYIKESICPICGRYVKKSDYLAEVFKDNPKVEWLANLITHYRHTHITSWNKCWEYGGHNYRRNWFKDYDEEKAIVNERAKRQIMRKSKDILLKHGITVEHFKTLQNTTDKTIELAEKLLKRKEDISSAV